MKKKFLTVLQYIFFSAIAVFFIWLSLKGMDSQKWAQLKGALDRANYWLLIPVLLLLLASHWLRALRWRQLIEPLGYTPSRINCFLGVMIGYFVNLGPLRLGEVIKCTILARYEKVPVDKLVGTIVAERAFDVVCLLTIFGLTLILQYDVIHTMMGGRTDMLFRNAQGQTSWIKIILAVAVGVLLIFLARWFFNKFSHLTPVRRIRNIIVNIWHGLTTVKDIKNKPLFFVYTVAIWGLYLFSTWFGFFAIEATRHLGVQDALSVLAMGSIGMIVSPGGIGAYALLVQETVAFYGVPSLPFGQALGWLLWFGQFISFVLFGTISFILLPRINSKPHYEIIEHEGPANHPAKNI